MISLPHKTLAGVILAAGGSRRLGQSKQLCEWKGKPLICHAVEASLAVCGEEVVVVTGADATEVEAKLQSYSVQIARNMGWETGMAASLQTGVRQLRGGKITGVLVLLCDQPMISVDDLTSLVNVWNALPEHPAASQYGGVYGVPAIFPKNSLAALMTLQGDTGARSLLDACPTISGVEMPSAAFDIDTVEDLAKLNDVS